MRNAILEQVLLGDPGAGLVDAMLEVRRFDVAPGARLDGTRATIVIPVRGARDALRFCLRSLKWALVDFRGRLDVDVVLAGAPDESLAALAGELLDGVQWCVVDTMPQGFAANCNAGARAARGEVLLFLNSDAWLSRPALERLVDVAEETGAAGPVGCNVSGQQFADMGTWGTFRAPSAAEVNSLDNLAAGLEEFALRWRKQRIPAPPHPGPLVRTTRLVGYCLAVRASDFWRAGAWDERIYGLGNYEDDDLSVRLLLAGAAPTIVLDAAVPHQGQASFLALDPTGETYNGLLHRNAQVYASRWDWLIPTLRTAVHVDGIDGFTRRAQASRAAADLRDAGAEISADV